MSITLYGPNNLFEAHRAYKNRQGILQERGTSLYWFSVSDISTYHDVYKSTDNGVTWVVQDARSSTTYVNLWAAGAAAATDHVRIGDVVWKFYLAGSGTNYRMLFPAKFDFNTDAWTINPGGLLVGPNVVVRDLGVFDPDRWWRGTVATAWAGGNKLFCAFSNIAGDGYRKLHCSVYDTVGHTWTTVLELTDTAYASAPLSAIYDEAAGNVHLLYQQDTNAIGATGSDVYIRHLIYDVAGDAVTLDQFITSDVNYGTQTDWPFSVAIGNNTLTFATLDKDLELEDGILRQDLYVWTCDLASNVWTSINVPFPTAESTTHSWNPSGFVLAGAYATSWMTGAVPGVVYGIADATADGTSGADPKVYYSVYDGVGGWSYEVIASAIGDPSDPRRYWDFHFFNSATIGPHAYAVTDYFTDDYYQEAYLFALTITDPTISVSDTLTLGDIVQVTLAIVSDGDDTITIDECPDVVAGSSTCSFVKTVDDSETSVTDCAENVYSETARPC